MKKIILITSIFIFLLPMFVQAAAIKSTYPRLVNYFLKWEISDSEVVELAKWDLLILDMEVQENSFAQLRKIRQLNPNIIILAYLTSQEIIDEIRYYKNAYLRQELHAGIHDSWWLRTAGGEKISFWPYTFMLNLSDGAGLDASGKRFNDYLPEFVVNRLQTTGLWDGVFYDNTWGDVTWVNDGNIDLDNDGQLESRALTDRLWAEGFKKMLAKTRQLAGPDFIIVGNGRVYDDYQGLMNGMMLESFPSYWEEDGTWAGSMRTYLKLPSLNVRPSFPIINVNAKDQENYQRMRFGLASALLGEGFYSYDYDITSHSQTWWYDEYSVNLGPAQSAAYNLLSNNSQIMQAGLWRRNFKNGVVVVNSTTQKQTYVLNREELEKIKGSQDAGVNNGQRVNYFILEPQDGLILLKINTEIFNSAFTNSYFYRIFNTQGQQIHNGFFAYADDYPSEAAVILASGSLDEQRAVSVGASKGKINLYQDGRIVTSFSAYNDLFKGSLSLAAKIDDGYFKKFIVGAGRGGGPQVRIFSPLGRLEASWFAYDKNLRGGVNVAIADVTGNGVDEIITGPGPGEEPRVKIFSQDGRLINSFLAYDQKFRGGINIVAGDLNGDGIAEIITAPASGGGPHIMIFNNQGHVRGNFFAYNKDLRGGFSLSLSDVNNDGRPQILVGIKNF